MKDPTLFDDWNFDFEELETSILERMVKNHLAELARQIKDDAKWFTFIRKGEPEFYVAIGSDDNLTEYLDIKIIPSLAKNLLLADMESTTNLHELSVLLAAVRE